MLLIIPLVIFVIASIAMVVIIYKTDAPSAIDTVEAYCDALLHEDSATQKDLLYKETTDIKDLIQPLKEKHQEPGTKYPLKSKRYEPSKELIEIVTLESNLVKGKINFYCQYMANQWLIIKIETE